MSNTHPRAPAARSKLEQAEQVLAELSEQTAVLALEASEGKAAAEKALTAHRSKIEAAERNVSDLRRAVELAERLDRQASAQLVATLRAESLADFKKAMAARDKAMAKVLDAAAMMAEAYIAYCEATQAAEVAVPAGAGIPIMQTWPNGIGGHSFGRQEQLILGELWRIAPRDERGGLRFSLPFAKCPLPMGMDHRKLPPAIEAFREADAVIVGTIEAQIRSINDAAMTAATTGEKEAA